MNVRLKDFEIDAITTHFRDIFLSKDRLWLFGSRADMSKKGGDIDLYIETNMGALDAEKARWVFINKICDSIGDQKIDVILNVLQSSHEQAIYAKAKSEGVQLI